MLAPEQAQEVQALLDLITSKKRLLLLVIAKSLKNYKRCIRREFVASLSQSVVPSPPLKQELRVQKASSKTLNVTKKLLACDDRDLTPERYLWKQLKKHGLLSETKLNAELRIKFKLLFVGSDRVKDTLKAISMSLVNDVQFVLKLRSFEQDIESFNYIKNKLKLELEGPQLRVISYQEPKTESSTKEREQT